MESGFRFCGMSDEPVEKASGKVAKPNSALDQRIASSASLDK